MNSNQIEIKKKKRSALIGSGILFVLATLNLWKGYIPHCVVLYSLSAFIFIMAGFFTKRFIKITHAIGESVAALLLFIVFFIAVTPIGLLMRMLKKRPAG